VGHVFLDLDGTLTDPRPGITASVTHALRTLGLPAPDPDDLTWVIGPPLIDSFQRLGAPDPALALQHYRARFAETGLFENRVYDGVPAMLHGLRRTGHRLYLATAKPHVYATRITSHFALDQYLDHQFGPELDGTRNDKSRLLAHALRITGADPAHSVMVGDRHHDIDAARAMGIASIAVTWGYGTAPEHAGADAICDAVDRLPDIIAGLLKARS
jgi:phosphoglycolate phosphatase